MDLLSQIMDSMDKDRPPATSQPDKIIQKENQQRKQVVEKERLFINNYKLKVQNKITAFLKDSEKTHLQFESEDKILRTICHGISEDAGLLSMAFGDVDRYLVVYKNPPSEDEINARKCGYNTWNDEIAIEYKQKKETELIELQELQDAGQEEVIQKVSKKSKIIHEKMDCKAIGSEIRNYGMVSNELKKDTRSIEQALNDIQKKKKLKTSHIESN